MGMLWPPFGKLRILSVPQVIRTSAFFRRSTPVRLGPFVETDTFRIEAARDNDWSTQREQTWLVLAERYFAVHDGSVRDLFYSQCAAGNFRPLSHYS
jgi:hypothetical protein